MSELGGDEQGCGKGEDVPTGMSVWCGRCCCAVHGSERGVWDEEMVVRGREGRWPTSGRQDRDEGGFGGGMRQREKGPG